MTEDIGRREFIKLSAAAGVIASTGGPASGALPHVATSHAVATAVDIEYVRSSSALATRHLDSKEFCLSELDAISPTHSFTATNVPAARRWQLRARHRLTERLGGFPSTRAPLNAEVLESKDLGSYTRERIVFDTRHNLSAVGYLLLPKDGARPLPAVVCVSGHGRGVHDILGMTDDGAQRAERVGYAKDYAVQCVERGHATFAVEQLAFGSRRDEAARRAGPAVDSCRPAATSALLLGQTMAGWRVWDVMRAIDYLATRNEVDSTRVATMGASGGGTVSLLTAALDQRVKLAVVSAYFNTFRDSIVSISHCPDNYVPGLARDMEMFDLAGLVAPRALFVESGRNDKIFPVAGSQVAADKAKEIYRTFRIPERMGYEIHEGAHEFNGVGAFAFMKQWL